MSQKKLSNLVNGFMKKHRTRQEIDQEYQFHAANIGHKMDTVRELEEQIENHHQALPKLKAEMAAANKAAQEQAEKEQKKLGKGVQAPMPQQSPAPAPAEAPVQQVSP